MARSYPLTAYLALRRGVPNTAMPGYAPRPNGPVVWAHTTDPARIPALVALADRLAADGDRLHLLITAPDIPANAPSGMRTILQPLPPDLRVPASEFLDHWQPDLLLWCRGDFRPVLLTEARRRIGLTARILIDAAAPQIGLAQAGWIPGATRAIVSTFDHALAIDDEAGQRLRRTGLDPARIEVTGALGAIAGVLPCNERERRDLAQTFGSRPVWLVAGLCPADVPDVILAHRLASRSAHRLLLILVPGSPDDAPMITQALREAGLALAVRADGMEPDEGTQVYLADSMAEMGLWYRLSPITFIGGTLQPGSVSRHPFEAAALGSAVLHGPQTVPHLASYLRLARAGASRTVRNGTELGQAIEALLAPDKAAAMAHAAWDVTTAGADVGNRVIELIRENLDKAER